MRLLDLLPTGVGRTGTLRRRDMSCGSLSRATGGDSPASVPKPSTVRAVRTPPRLPQFYGIGPSRTGTTWLHEVLQGHAGTPRLKETHFFDKYYARGIQWYADLFAACDPDLPVGEMSPCFALPAARERMRKHVPDCKIICTLRDPVDRAYSYYKLARCLGMVGCGFEEALDRHKLIADANHYAHHLAEWRKFFPAEQILTCFYDDLEADPQSYLDRICDFIGIARIQLADRKLEKQVNSFARAPRWHTVAQNARHLRQRLRSMEAYRTLVLLDRIRFWDCFSGGGEPFRPLDPQTDARVRARFIAEIEVLEAMLGRDLSAWKRTRANPAPPHQRRSSVSATGSSPSSAKHSAPLA